MKRTTLRIDAVARIETHQRRAFVVGSIITQEGGIAFDTGNESAMVDALLRLRGTVWWHCDDSMRDGLAWWLDRVMDRGLIPQVIVKGHTSRVLSVEVDGVRHHDSFSLWPVDLASWASGTAEPKEHATGKWACRCGIDCGGHCTLPRTLTPRDADTWRCLSLSWCRSAWVGLARLAATQKALDIDGKITAGASAWATVRRRDRLEDADKSWSRHHLARRAYYPGRTDVGLRESSAGYEWDTTMAHPSVYGRIPLPYGEPTQLMGGAAAAYATGEEGFYTMQVEVPEVLFPVLPMRTPTRKVGHPVGIFEGTWPSPLIRFAERQGMRIRAVTHAQVYPRTRILLKDWADTLYQARRDLENNHDPMAGYVKTLAVSLVGSWGLAPYAEDVIFDPPLEAIQSCPCTYQNASECPCGGVCCGGCDGQCGAFTLISPAHSIWSRRRRQIRDQSHVVWSAFTVAHTTINLLTHAFEFEGGDDVIHLATDGFLSVHGRSIHDTGLGGFYLKRRLGEIRVLNSGTYQAVDVDTGEVLIRASGEPRRTAAQYLAEGASVNLTPTGLRQGLVQGRAFGKVLERTRIRQTEKDENGLFWFGSRPGRGDGTRAPTVAELCSL